MAKTTVNKPSSQKGKARAQAVRGESKKATTATKAAKKPASKISAKVTAKTNASARPAAKAKTPLPNKSKASSSPAKAVPPRPRPQPAPVAAPAAAAPAPAGGAPANGKNRKSPSGLSARELEHFRDLLLAKRRELIGDMSSMEREALRSSGGSNLSNLPIHMADMGTDNYEQEFTLGLVQKDRDLLKEINLALAKLQNGTFGLCEGTGQPINKERLEFQPWVRYSVEHQRKMERHGR